MDVSRNLSEELAATDRAIERYKVAIKRGEALERLKSTADYKLVIADYCLTESAEELFNILTEPSGASPYTEEAIQLQLAAISYLKGKVGHGDYKGSIEVEAFNAPLQIEREEDFRKEITATQGDDNE